MDNSENNKSELKDCYDEIVNNIRHLPNEKEKDSNRNAEHCKLK